MRFVYVLPIIVAVAGVRLYMRHRSRQKKAASESASAPAATTTGPTTGAAATASTRDASTAVPTETSTDTLVDVSSGPAAQRTSSAVGDEPIAKRRPWFPWFGNALGDAGLVAQREIRERVRGRIFKVGTLLILLGVAAAIVIPKIHSSSTTSPQRVGVVGQATPGITQVVKYSGEQAQTPVQIVPEQSLADAEAALRSGNLDLAIVGGDRIVVNEPLSANGKTSSPTSDLVQVLAPELGVLHAYQEAGLSPAQIETVAHAKAVPVESLQGGSTKGVIKGTSVIGVVLIFLMLTQYNTWILIGVMQEKASRVVEVLLATVRPLELLGGKVLGIGLVALGQAALIVAEAFILSKAVGSDLLHGTGPVLILSDLLWLVLGYAFYCWVYAAAGSTAERQDQVQTLALPLSLPIIIGYVYSITVASSGNPSLLFEVLAYLPPTAPFAMPVLVSLDLVAWWQFLASVIISLAGTAVIAWFAAGIYRRAVLRSGQRVSLRDLRPRASRRVATPA
jgi:ABC-2 type transport system permease protein